MIKKSAGVVVHEMFKRITAESLATAGEILEYVKAVLVIVSSQSEFCAGQEESLDLSPLLFLRIEEKVVYNGN